MHRDDLLHQLSEKQAVIESLMKVSVFSPLVARYLNQTKDNALSVSLCLSLYSQKYKRQRVLFCMNICICRQTPKKKIISV